MRQKRDSLSEPRPWTRKIAARINCEYASLSDRRQVHISIRKLSSSIFRERTFDMEATRHHHNNFRVARCDLLSTHLKRWLACAPQNIFPASLRHHFRHPVTTDIIRIKPFQTQNSWTRLRLRSLGFYRGDFLFQSNGEGLRFAPALRSISRFTNIIPNIAQRM